MRLGVCITAVGILLTGCGCLSGKGRWNDSYRETMRQLRKCGDLMPESDYRTMPAEEVEAKFLPESARSFDTIVVEDAVLAAEKRRGAKDVDPLLARISRPGLAQEFLGMVRFRAVEVAAPTWGREHNCAGTANIVFVAGGSVVGEWDIAHGHILCPGLLTQESEEQIARWFTRNGLPQLRDWVVVLGADAD